MSKLPVTSSIPAGGSAINSDWSAIRLSVTRLLFSVITRFSIRFSAASTAPFSDDLNVRSLKINGSVAN